MSLNVGSFTVKQANLRLLNRHRDDLSLKYGQDKANGRRVRINPQTISSLYFNNCS